jgi:hypothetical protein
VNRSISPLHDGHAAFLKMRNSFRRGTRLTSFGSVFGSIVMMRLCSTPSPLRFGSPGRTMSVGIPRNESFIRWPSLS